jgi:RecA-family ATPase
MKNNDEPILPKLNPDYRKKEKESPWQDLQSKPRRRRRRAQFKGVSYPLEKPNQ